MLSGIENGKYNAILTWQINRLSRNPIDSAKIQWLLQCGVIKLIQTIDRAYYPDDSVLLIGVESSMANQYLLDLSKNVKRGIESKRQKGVYPHLAPVGYLNDKENHTIVEDPERFDMVKKMWEMMLSGSYTRNQIVDIVNNKWGFRTKKFKRMGGNQITRDTLYDIFSSPFYKGIYYFNGTEYPLTHTKMVTDDEYDRVQVMLGRKKTPKPKVRSFAYTGFIRCGECGCLYTAEIKKKLIKSTGDIREYTYYHCTRKKLDVKCSQKKINKGRYAGVTNHRNT